MHILVCAFVDTHHQNSVLKQFGSRPSCSWKKVSVVKQNFDSPPNNPLMLVPVWPVTHLLGDRQRFGFWTSCFSNSLLEWIKFPLYAFFYIKNGFISSLLGLLAKIKCSISSYQIKNGFILGVCLVILFLWHKSPKSRGPLTFLASGTNFVEDNFSTDGSGGNRRRSSGGKESKASLAGPPLTSCCAAGFLTAQGLGITA